MPLSRMPLFHSVLPSRRAIIVRATGNVSLKDHEQLVAALLHEPALEEGIPVLVDARGITSTVRIADLPRVATLTRMLTKRGMDLIAIVTDPGPVATLARAFELAARAVGVHAAVFDELQTARLWLRLSATEYAGSMAESPPSAAPDPGSSDRSG